MEAKRLVVEGYPEKINIRRESYVVSTGEPVFYQIEGHVIGTIGQVVILMNEYNPDQFWLPFVQAALVRPPPERDDRRNPWLDEMTYGWDDRQWRYGAQGYEHRRTIAMLQRMAEEPYARINSDHRQMYAYDFKLGPQYVLPFQEFRRVEQSEFHYAKHNWDVADEGDHDKDVRYFTLKWENIPMHEFVDWIEQNLTCRYYVDDRHREVVLSTYEDWLHLKLRFHGAQD